MRLLSSLIRAKTEPSGVGAASARSSAELDEVSPRGAVVSPDGTMVNALCMRLGSGAELASLEVESNPTLRSAALFQTHYLAQVSAEKLFDLHRRYGGLFEAEASALPPLVPKVAANPHRRLRIGYVSPNLCSHSVSYFIEPVLAHHDRASFEVYCYHTGSLCDHTTERIESSADAWRQVNALSDDALAHLIVDDRIDVAVDLAGHAIFGRPAVFARRPAPLQLTWIGYPNTTGLRTIDYRITDAIADPPPHADAMHTERLLRLPGTFLCYRPPTDAPDVVARDESSSDVVFCSFNNIQKVNDTVIALWSRVLRAVPGSRLLIKSGRVLSEPAVAQRVRGAFAAQGIESSRIEIADWIEERSDHLALYGAADLALDTFPYNGTTTTCEALWMGVPVITLAGATHMSRVGSSLLTAVGLPELITDAPDAFVATAVSLARDRARRRALRAALRGRLAVSSLLDHAGFTRKLEAALRGVWIEWCSRQAP